MQITKNLKENIKNINNYYNIGNTFDIIARELLIGKKKAYLLMIDGFIKEQSMLLIIQRLQEIKPKTRKDLPSFIKSTIAYTEVEYTKDFAKVDSMFLSGAAVLFIDGYEDVIILDVREYQVRAVSEPDLEKVTRGPRDGFVETMLFNTTLIRRRIKDHNLQFKLKEVGNISKTNIAISYIEGKANQALVDNILKKIDQINIDSLTMGEKSLAELMFPNKWYNPMPKVRYSERPDVVASHLTEGHIIIVVDTSSSVLIIPTTLFHFTQYAEDYYQTPIVGTYIRQLRFIILLITLLLTPTWFLLYKYSVVDLWFLKDINEVNIPVFFQLLILEIGIDILRMSSIHTPASLSSTLGIIGGIILSNFAVDAGFLSVEVILFTAITGLCSFAIPMVELSYAMQIFRLFLLIITGIFKLPGFIIGLIIIIIIIATTNNGTKTPYLYPLIPMNFKDLKNIVFRMPIPRSRNR